MLIMDKIHFSRTFTHSGAVIFVEILPFEYYHWGGRVNTRNTQNKLQYLDIKYCIVCSSSCLVLYGDPDHAVFSCSLPGLPGVMFSMTLQPFYCLCPKLGLLVQTSGFKLLTKYRCDVTLVHQIQGNRGTRCFRSSTMQRRHVTHTQGLINLKKHHIGSLNFLLKSN